MNDELQDGLLGPMQALQNVRRNHVQFRSTHRATEGVNAEGTSAGRATLRMPVFPQIAMRPSTLRTQI